MTQTYRNKTGRTLARTCWFTALLNGLFAAQGAESLPQPPSSPTRPTTPSSPLIPGNPGDDEYGSKWSPSPLQYGPMDVHLRVFGGAYYDDNIFTSDSNKESDFILSLSPTITAGFGDYRERQANLLTLEYTPTFSFYADDSSLNNVNHDLLGEGQFKTGPWRFNLSQGYTHLFDSDVDAATLIGRDIYTTKLSTVYEISPKTSVELNGRQSINDVGDSGPTKVSANSYNEWVMEAFGDYQATPKLKAGLGLSAGWVDTKSATKGQSSANSAYQQILARVSYAITEKVDLSGRVGGQLQEFEEIRGAKEDNRLNGVFSFGVGYRPVERTALAVSAYREDQSSIILVNEAYTSTGLDFTVRQALTDRISAGLSGGYAFKDYYETAKSANSDRQDNYWRVQVSVDWQVLDELRLGVFYQYRKNDSAGGNADDFSFGNNQVGLNVSYRF